MNRDISEKLILLKINKKGSSSVFLLIILGSMVAVTLSFIFAANQVATVAYTNSILVNAGRSILSEYNLELKDRYGLLAFGGQASEIEEALEKYVNYSIDERPSIRLEGINANMSAYSMTNLERFENQVAEYAKYAIAHKLIRNITDEHEESRQEVDTEKSGKVLRNSSIICDLPSKQGDGNVAKSLVDSYLIDSYIFGLFKNGQNTESEFDTFFKYEIEYIVIGSLDDDKNRKYVRTKIKSMRYATNLECIKGDSVLMAQVSAIAESLTPGQGNGTGTATEQAVTMAWADLESENDIRLLEAGYSLPLEKKQEDWAVKAQNVIEGIVYGYIKTEHSEENDGLNYEGYLRTFLAVLANGTKYRRMMDLMQINIQGSWDSAFLIKEHSFGLEIKAAVNGREYDYKQEY